MSIDRFTTKMNKIVILLVILALGQCFGQVLEMPDQSLNQSLFEYEYEPIHDYSYIDETEELPFNEFDEYMNSNYNGDLITMIRLKTDSNNRYFISVTDSSLNELIILINQLITMTDLANAFNGGIKMSSEENSPKLYAFIGYNIENMTTPICVNQYTLDLARTLDVKKIEADNVKEFIQMIDNTVVINAANITIVNLHHPIKIHDRNVYWLIEIPHVLYSFAELTADYAHNVITLLDTVFSDNKHVFNKITYDGFECDLE